MMSRSEMEALDELRKGVDRLINRVVVLMVLVVVSVMLSGFIFIGSRDNAEDHADNKWVIDNNKSAIRLLRDRFDLHMPEDSSGDDDGTQPETDP